MEVLTEIKKKSILIDSTFLDKLQACAFQYHIARNLLIQEKDIPKVEIEEGEVKFRHPYEALEKGDLTHHFFKWYYENKKNGVDYDTCINLASIAFRDKALKKNIDIKDTEWVLDCIIESVNFWKTDGWTPLIIETPFIKLLHENSQYKFYYAGQVDLIPNTYTGKVLVDHKSYTRWFPPAFMSNQFMSYSWATGLRNVIVNRVGLQKSYQEPEKKHKRPILSYTEGHINQWISRAIWWMEQLVFYLENNTWPQNPTSCDKFNGCPYRPLCTAESDNVRDWLIQTEYRIGEVWDVSKDLEKELTNAPT